MSLKNRFFTLMIIPEKSQDMKRIVVPGWILPLFVLGIFALSAIGTVMILDYWYVKDQVTENQQLKLENRRLRQQVRIFENKIEAVDQAMDRIKRFTTRLRVITNSEGTRTDSASVTPRKPSIEELNLPNTIPPEGVALIEDALNLKHEFGVLASNTNSMEVELQNVYEILADRKSFLRALPTRKPAIGYFTSGFGIRKSPFGGRAKMHEGLDIANRPGTPVLATADGTVIYSTVKAGYGNTIIVDHGYGLQTWYGHNRKLVARVGDRVIRGQKVALLGSSGQSTGPHVHYEVRVNGIPVDPLSYILED